MSNTKKENLYMKSFNGDKIFSLEYDKETLRDMIIDKQEEIESLQHELKIKESYFHNMCASYEADIKGLKKLINIYKKSGNKYYLIDKDDFNEFDDLYSVLSYIDFMELKDYKLIKGVIIDERKEEKD